MAALIPIFLKEIEQESETTRKMLSRIPDDKYDWKPHPKSMSVRQLATHIAELPSWFTMVLTTKELDFAKNTYNPVSINNTKELMDYFEKTVQEGKTQLVPANEDKLDEIWTLRSGDQIFSATSKAEVLRMVINQIVHHRAQMGVFLRLNNIAIPGSYGPSADEH